MSDNVLGAGYSNEDVLHQSQDFASRVRMLNKVQNWDLSGEGSAVVPLLNAASVFTYPQRLMLECNQPSGVEPTTALAMEAAGCEFVRVHKHLKLFVAVLNAHMPADLNEKVHLEAHTVEIALDLCHRVCLGKVSA